MIMQTKESMMNLKVPTQMKNEFKAFCAKRGYNMREALNELMQSVLRGEVKLPEKGTK